jgi:hypothetical protein
MRHRNNEVEVFFSPLEKDNVHDLFDWYNVVVVLENINNFECGSTGKLMVEMSFYLSKKLVEESLSWCSA